MERRRNQSKKERDERRRRRHSSEWESWASDDSCESSPVILKQRARRTRTQVNYRFEDFEHLIDEAIGDEVRQVKEAAHSKTSK